MGFKNFNFDEFRTETLTLKSRGYAIGSNMGLTSTPTTTESGIHVSIHRLSGDRRPGQGTNVADATHYAITDYGHTFLNGDIVVDSGGISYEVMYYEHVTSFMGDYDGLELREIRE